MAIADDFTVGLTGDIRYTGGGSTYYTVLELHRFLQDLADDAQASGNDLVDITSVDSSDRSTDNIITLNSPYNIDDDAAEQLYDGSITQLGGATVYSGLVIVGSVESGTELLLFRDNLKITSWWSTGINADAPNNIISRMLIRTRIASADIDGKRLRVMARELGDSYAEFSVTMGLGNSTAAIFTGPDLNNTTVEATIATWTGITDVDPGYNLIDLNNGNGAQPYYSEWDKDVYTINQLYERTKWIQRRGTSTTIHGVNGEFYRGITHEFDYDGKSGTITEDNAVAWGTYFVYDTEAGGPFTLDEYVTIGASGAIGKLVFLEDLGATGNMAVALEDTSVTLLNNDVVTGLTSGATAAINVTIGDNDKSGGTGILLADDASDTVWIQVTSGVAPVDNSRFYDRTVYGYALVNGSVTQRTVSPEFFGVSTGTAIIGAFGIGVEAADLTNADKLTDLLNVLQQPPNNQTFTVSGLVSGEDRVIVGPNDGADELDLDQFTLNTSLLGATETAVVLTGAIPADTPATGTIRIELDTGIYRRQAYTSWTASTFTIASSDYTGANNATAPTNVFISYIDLIAAAATAAFTAVYGSDRSLLGKVRDGGGTPIKPFKTPTTFTSGGGGFTAIRTSDL